MNAQWLKATVQNLEESAEQEHPDRHDRTTTLFFSLPEGLAEEAAGGPAAGVRDRIDRDS